MGIESGRFTQTNHRCFLGLQEVLRWLELHKKEKTAKRSGGSYTLELIDWYGIFTKKQKSKPPTQTTNWPLTNDCRIFVFLKPKQPTWICLFDAYAKWWWNMVIYPMVQSVKITKRVATIYHAWQKGYQRTSATLTNPREGTRISLTQQETHFKVPSSQKSVTKKKYKYPALTLTAHPWKSMVDRWWIFRFEAPILRGGYCY